MKRREFLMLAAALPAAMQTLASTKPEGSADFLETLVKEGTAPGAALVARYERRGRSAPAASSTTGRRLSR
jgi:predicted Zn-dependent peptidase